jgi:hypothetical protein
MRVYAFDLMPWPDLAEPLWAHALGQHHRGRAHPAPPKQKPTEKTERTAPPSLDRRWATAAAMSACKTSGLVWGMWDMKSTLSPRSSVLAERAKKSMANASTAILDEAHGQLLVVRGQPAHVGDDDHARARGRAALLPRPVRVVDGLLIGIGGLGLAFTMWRRAR